VPRDREHAAQALIEVLRQLPSEARSFTHSASDARRWFGLDEELLAQLVDWGLPACDSAGGPWFDICDLHYVGLRVGTAHAYLWAIRSWARSLEALDAGPTSHVTLRYLPQLAEGERETAGTVRLPDERRGPVVLRREEAAAELTLEVPARRTAPRPALAPLVEEVGTLEFCLLPEALQTPAVARSTGLCDCEVASQLLMRRCEAEGLHARRSHGIILAAPYASTHNWVEVLVDDAWTVVDPLLMKLLRQFGGLDAERWPLTRSPEALLCRLGDESAGVVEDAAGERIETILLTTIARQEGGPTSGLRSLPEARVLP
jgi:hypothetical protein